MGPWVNSHLSPKASGAPMNSKSKQGLLNLEQTSPFADHGAPIAIWGPGEEPMGPPEQVGPLKLESTESFGENGGP